MKEMKKQVREPKPNNAQKMAYVGNPVANPLSTNCSYARTQPMLVAAKSISPIYKVNRCSMLSDRILTTPNIMVITDAIHMMKKKVISIGIEVDIPSMLWNC